MALFSPKQPADDGTVRPVIEALQREDAGTLAMTDEGLVDLAKEEFDPEMFASLQHQKLVAEDAVASTLDPTPPSYSVMVGSVWRMLEEQRLTAELDAAYRRLKKLSTRLVAAQERERTIISRELHDVLGQTLTGMVIHLHAARKAADPQAATAFTDTAMQMAQEAVQQVKTLSFSLRPAQLDLLGLAAAIRSALQRLADPAGVRVSMTTRGKEPEKLSETASVAVRLVQEAVTNTLRHAGASRISVRLRFLPAGRMALVVADNGKGFDRDFILDGQPSEKNLGVYGMIERTELAGGRLAIRTRPGKGVIIRALL